MNKKYLINNKLKIRTKLIIFVTSSIVLSLVLVGFAINLILTDLYKERATTELNHAYDSFQRQLHGIENNILSLAVQISTDKSVKSVINLVNKYQDKNNYNDLIFNNDKKNIADYLLTRIALTKAERDTIYDINGDLIAYAVNNDNNTLSGIVSYKNGSPEIIHKLSQHSQWIPGKLPEKIKLKSPTSNKTFPFPPYTGKIEYTTNNNMLTIQSNKPIVLNKPDGEIKLLGLVKTAKSLDSQYFNKISDTPNIQISLVFSDGNILGSPPLNISPKMLSQQSNLLSSENHENALLLDHKSHFIHAYAWPTNTGHNYLVISQSKVNLTTALNTTRQSIIIIFLFIAALAIISGILWLNQFITKPVNALVAHADVDENSAYPVFPISESNDEIGLLGKVLNSMVDKIKEREESLTQTAIQLKNTQNLAKIGGWEQDHIHNTMKWSEEVFRILDLDSKNTIPSPELIAEHIHPDDLPLVKIAYLESVTNKKSYDVTHRIQLEDGTEKHVHVYTETQYDENGLPAITIGTIQDTSEQILLDEQMRRTQKMDALGKLTGGIAHDFNNLLGVILGFTELLQLKTDANKNPKDADFLAQIYQAGDRAQKLTSKLLAFSRTETPTADLVDVNQLIKEEQHLLEKTLTVRIKLTFNFQDEIWPVWLDKNELKDTLLNMSINSMHAMPNGGELTLDTHNIHLDDLDIGKLKIPPGDYILLTITDTGIGMDRQTSQRMFEPFFTTKQEKGTGLGMSQVYGFVQRAKGAIHVYSELNHGTRISIYFPRYFPEINNGRQRKHTIKYENLSGSEKILVVDDELSLRNLASEILSAQGYQVISAKNGKDALEILKSEQIDILFSDVIMPEMDGYKLASIVKKQYPSIKIQLASGFSNTDLNTDQQELYEQRLSKPFTSKDLLRKIQTLTQKPNVSVKKELNL